jgi:HEAT repeat protein
MRAMHRALWGVFLLASCSGPEANTRSKDPYDRYLGVREIGQARDVASEPELVRLLDDPHYLVVTGVLESMAEIGRKEYLPYALPRLKVGHPMVRAQACATVAAVGGAEGLEPVLSVLKDDSEASVRRAAVKALAFRYGTLARAREALVEAVGDRDASLSLMAHERLRELTGRTDLPRTKEAWAQAVRP